MACTIEFSPLWWRIAASTLKILNPAAIKLEMYARIKDPRTWLFFRRYGRRLLPEDEALSPVCSWTLLKHAHYKPPSRPLSSSLVYQRARGGGRSLTTQKLRRTNQTTCYSAYDEGRSHKGQRTGSKTFIFPCIMRTPSLKVRCVWGLDEYMSKM